MKTQTYTKINTLYKRFTNLSNVDLPNKDWKIFQNKIMLGQFSDKAIEYIASLKFDCFSKIDGTNTKIVYYPSTGKCIIGGKTDNADIIGSGQKNYMEPIIERIKPELAKLFPSSTAKFSPVLSENNLPVYYPIDVPHQNILSETSSFQNLSEHPIDRPTAEGIWAVYLEEVPVYIYGEFYGAKIGGAGNYDKNPRFEVFDICDRGWWVPIDMLQDYCDKLGLVRVPYVGQMTIAEAEDMVKKGFKTKVNNPANPNYIEEGLVCRPVFPIKDERGKRIIVKIKHRDYRDLAVAIEKVGEDEYKKFYAWYLSIEKTLNSPEYSK